MVFDVGDREDVCRDAKRERHSHVETSELYVHVERSILLFSLVMARDDLFVAFRSYRADGGGRSVNVTCC